MNDTEWAVIVDTIKEVVPEGECDCDGLPKCLTEELAKRLNR